MEAIIKRSIYFSKRKKFKFKSTVIFKIKNHQIPSQHPKFTSNILLVSTFNVKLSVLFFPLLLSIFYFLIALTTQSIECLSIISNSVFSQRSTNSHHNKNYYYGIKNSTAFK